jgi:hypothetical protein
VGLGTVGRHSVSLVRDLLSSLGRSSARPASP